MRWSARASAPRALALATLASMVLALHAATGAAAAPPAPPASAPSAVGAEPLPTARAESQGVAADLTLTAPRGLQPGVPIQARVAIAMPDGATAAPPELSGTLGAWDVRDARIVRGATPGTATLEFTLTAWDSGTLPVPAVPLSVELADGTRVRLAVGPLEVTVESLLGAQQDLTELAAPARGPVDISTIRWAWWIAAALGAGICMWLARRLFWSAKAEAALPPLPAHVWAMREFDRLEQEHLPDHGQVDSFFARLSDIVRHYVEQRWGISAPEQTTKEFLRSARHHPELAGSHEHTLARFLRTADMVKFAAQRPGNPECSQALGSMREFVVESAPHAPHGAQGTPAEGAS